MNNSSAMVGIRISYLYKYDDDTYWKVIGYVDNFGCIIPIYATNYTYGVR